MNCVRWCEGSVLRLWFLFKLLGGSKDSLLNWFLIKHQIFTQTGQLISPHKNTRVDDKNMTDSSHNRHSIMQKKENSHNPWVFIYTKNNKSRWTSLFCRTSDTCNVKQQWKILQYGHSILIINYIHHPCQT
jgi:hypothetical protein